MINSQALSDAAGAFQTVSSIPGRIRCCIPGLRRNPGLAILLERELRNIAGVVESAANPVTGRILIYFDAALEWGEIEERLRGAIATSRRELARLTPIPIDRGLRDENVNVPQGRHVSAWVRYGLILPAGFFLPGLFGVGLLKGFLWTTGAGVVAGLVLASARQISGTTETTGAPEEMGRSGLLNPYRGRFISAILLSAVNKILDLSPPLFIGAALNIVASGPIAFMAGLGLAAAQTQLWVLGGLSVLGWSLASYTEYLNKVTWRNLSQVIQHDLRTRVYQHIQTLDISFVEDHSTGELLSFLHQDIDTVGRFVDVGANELVQTITSTVVISATLLVIAPSISAAAVLSLPFIMVVTVFYHRYIGGLYAEVRKRSARFSQLVGNNISGISTIKIVTAEAEESERVYSESLALKNSYRRVNLIAATYSPAIRMVVTAGATYTLIAGGLLAISGSISLGGYSIMVFLTQRLIWPLVATGDAFDLFQHSRAGLRRIGELLDVQPEIRSGSLWLPKKSIRGKVVFDNVTFSYPGGATIFDRLNLEINEGEQIGIVGPTGAGKTTLAKLMLRFYEPDSGSIYIDGVDIRDVRVSDLRGAVGLVGQENFLFYGTIRENIAFGRRDAGLEEIARAAQVAEIDEFINSLPDGYDTFVGEDGYRLSGGERQRVSIARAVLRDPAILCLDEATSAVDYETEAALKHSLARVTQGRTTIIIAHRLSTVRNAHRICVINRGAICEEGEHEELLSRGGLYSSLWRIQTGDESSLLV
jgi:ATP-binding cassette subfamily B protein